MNGILKTDVRYEEGKWYFTSSDQILAEYVYESKIVDEPLFIVKMSKKEAKKAKLKGILREEVKGSNFVIVMMLEELKLYSDVIPPHYYEDLYNEIQGMFFDNENWF